MYQLLKFLFLHNIQWRILIIVGLRNAVRIEIGHERAEKLFLYYIHSKMGKRLPSPEARLGY